MISKKCFAEEIFEYVRETQKIRILKDSLIRLVEAGIIPVEELERLTYGES